MTSKKTTTTKRVVPKKVCARCGSPKRFEMFYNSKSTMFKYDGKMPICKECVGDMNAFIFGRTNSEEKTMYRLCRKLDIPYREKLFNIAKSEADKMKSEIYKLYIQKLNSLGGINGYGDDFDDSDYLDIHETKEMVNDTENVALLEKEMMDGFELDVDIIKRWGSNHSLEDYKFLEDEFNDWISKHEVDSKSLEDLLKQLCHTQLTIKKKRDNDDPVDKDLKTYQDILSSCNLKPSQESAMSAAEQATFGTLIKKWENERPIPEPDPEWKDVNKISKYIRIWFTGHLSRMMGVDAGVTNEYLEEINEYTVDGGSDV